MAALQLMAEMQVLLESHKLLNKSDLCSQVDPVLGVNLLAWSCPYCGSHPGQPRLCSSLEERRLGAVIHQNALGSNFGFFTHQSMFSHDKVVRFL